MADPKKLPFKFVISAAELRDVVEEFVVAEIDKRLPPGVTGFRWGMSDLEIVVKELPSNVSVLGRRRSK